MFIKLIHQSKNGTRWKNQNNNPFNFTLRTASWIKVSKRCCSSPPTSPVANPPSPDNPPSPPSPPNPPAWAPASPPSPTSPPNPPSPLNPPSPINPANPPACPPASPPACPPAWPTAIPPAISPTCPPSCSPVSPPESRPPCPPEARREVGAALIEVAAASLTTAGTPDAATEAEAATEGGGAVVGTGPYSVQSIFSFSKTFILLFIINSFARQTRQLSAY